MCARYHNTYSEVLWSPCFVGSELFWWRKGGLHFMSQILKSFNTLADECIWLLERAAWQFKMFIWTNSILPLHLFSEIRCFLFIYLEHQWYSPSGFLCLPYEICSVAVKLKSTMCVILCVSSLQCSLPVQSMSMCVPVGDVCLLAWGVMDMITVLIALMKYVLLQSLHNPDTNTLGAYICANQE